MSFGDTQVHTWPDSMRSRWIQTVQLIKASEIWFTLQLFVQIINPIFFIVI